MNAVMPWLAADPVLPHRDTLLDADAMRGRFSRVLSAHGPLILENCERIRVNYQLARSLRVLYRLTIDGTPRLVASRMFRGGRSGAAFEAAAATAAVANGVRPIALDADLDAVYWSFPYDRKIKALPLLLAPPDELSHVVEGGWMTSTLVAYAPEKTATAACIDASQRITAFVKVASANQTERDYSFYQAIRASLPPDDPHLVVPEAFAFSSAHRMMWLQAIQGRRVGKDGDWIDDLRLMGAAVARFHACAVPHAPVFKRFDGDQLSRAAHILASVRPDLCDTSAALAARLTERAVAAAAAVCLHGDLHPKNALVCGRRVALLDVEDLASGPAACDIGSFLGALDYVHIVEGVPQEACAQRASAFLAGYQRLARLPDAASLAWHVAAAIFVERAVRAVTRIRPIGLGRLAALLDRANQILTRGLDV